MGLGFLVMNGSALFTGMDGFESMGVL